MKTQKGMVLVGVIALMVVAGLFLAASSSMVFTSAASSSNVIQGTQALAIAQAGAQWYKEVLRTDSDWTDQTDLNSDFAGGRFYITVLSKSPSEVRFRSTGNVFSSSDNNVYRRYEEYTVQKLPAAFKFAVFQNASTGLRLINLRSIPTLISGPVWSGGNVQIPSPSQVINGKVYVPAGKQVSGTGTYTAKMIDPPSPAMPVINQAPYHALMDGFDALLDADTSNTDLVLNDQTFTVSGVMNFRSVTVRGNSEFRGNGTIVARDSIDIATSASVINTHTFIIPYNNKPITFIANKDVEIGSTSGYPSVIANGSTVYYSRKQGHHLRVQGTNNLTSIENGSFLARNRIEMKGPVIFGSSMMFLDASASPSNQIVIQGNSTTQTSFTGNIMSMSDQLGAVTLNNTSGNKMLLTVHGLIYAGGNGTCQIRNSYVAGSAVCSRFDMLYFPTILYQAPSSLPEGFDNQISVKDNSWDGT